MTVSCSIDHVADDFGHSGAMISDILMRKGTTDE